MGGTRRSITAKNRLRTDLFAYWKMNEAAGADALDAHGAVTFTQENSPGAADGLAYATARTLDGGTSSQAFSRSFAASLANAFGDVDHTFAVWCNHAAWATNPPFEYHYIISVGQNTVGGFQALTNALHQVVGTWYVAGQNASTQVHCATTLTNLDTWYLLWFAWDKANNVGKVAVDTGPWTTEAESDPPHTAAGYGSSYVGRFGAGNWFDGKIGPMALWSRLLSDAERLAYYNNGIGLRYDQLT